MRERWKGPLVVKGILSPADAAMARDCGADGIIMSNHGGRQLDHAVSPMQTLTQVLERSGDLTVMIDSGFRRGTDVVKAFGLGAQAVFVGRPFLFAAAYAGEPGVTRAIALLAKEIDRDMAMLGLRDIRDVGREWLFRAQAA
jgi:L-lactate dehydrogenase (cytochrome)